MEWLFENKEWLLSGVGIAVPLALIGWFFASKGKQVQKAGKNSTNIQVGGNLSIGKRKEDD